MRSRQFQTEYLPDEKLFDASEKDQSNPNRRSLTNGWTEGCSGVSLIQKNDDYHRAMIALMDIVGKLPILPVLQAYIFNPKYFTRFHAKNMRDETINHEEFKIKYPEGVLAYPKRVWPEFYSIAS